MEIHSITNAALALVAELNTERTALINGQLALQKELVETKKKLQEVSGERLELLKEKEASREAQTPQD